MTLENEVNEFGLNAQRLDREVDVIEQIINSPLGVDLVDLEGKPIKSMRQALQVLIDGGGGAPLNAVNIGDVLKKVNNLSDLPDKVVALANLGGIKSESGIWTPSFGNADITADIHQPEYVITGNICTFAAYINNMNITNAASYAVINGLPANAKSYTLINTGHATCFNAATHSGYVDVNSSRIIIRNGQGAGGLGWQNGNNRVLMISGSYVIA
ncbi:MAG: hypothetical protein HRU28_19485 [Rhizobiales bacterium]|nr:hypothetical protein [Hyphomicrobiales bacterium]